MTLETNAPVPRICLICFYVFNIYDKTKAVDIMHLDFQKTFNKVPHKDCYSGSQIV